jgi:hypothetical protein
MQSLYMRERQHRSDAWRDETCCPLYRHAATLPNRLDDWSFRPILHCQIDMVRCRVARAQVENHVIEALRGAGYNLYNKSLAYDTNDRRRAQMRAWRIAHGQGQPGSYTPPRISFNALLPDGTSAVAFSNAVKDCVQTSENPSNIKVVRTI